MVTTRSEIREHETQGTQVLDTSFEIVKLIDRLFKIGSYPLVAIGLGALFTVSYIFALNTGFAGTTPMSGYWLPVFGLAVVLMVGGFGAALIASFFAHRKIHDAIRNYQGTIEKAHDISLESINAVRSLNEMLLLHVDTVAQVLEAASPIIAAFEGKSFVNSRYLSSDLVAFCNRTQAVIADVEKAITRADLKALHVYCTEIGQLATLTKQSIERFKQREWASDHVSRFTKSISSAREAALAYSNSATTLHDRIDAAISPIIVKCRSINSMPVVGAWLASSGINDQIAVLQGLETLLHKAQAANLAVGAVVASPGKDRLEAAVQCMQSLQQGLANEVNL